MQDLLKFLIKSPIDFVIIGGFAAVLHGSSQTTRDIDICVLMTPENIAKLRQTLHPINPRHRKTNDKGSFMETPQDISNIKNFHLDTDLGILDIVSSVPAVGEYYDVLKKADEIEMYGGKCSVISIEDLIKSKKALGRHRDLIVVEELEVILQEKAG